MDAPILGAALAFLGGAAVSALNFWINLRALRKNPAALANLSILRQALSAGYLFAVFLLARVLPWDYLPLLLGAAIGLTVPSVLFSLRLARINDALPAPSDENSGKGDTPHE